MITLDDRRHLAITLDLARRGYGRTSPNPHVGALIVKDGAPIAAAHHERAGEAHAEVLALGQAGEAAHGATLYVTIEPCCHQGRTPPCAKAIIAAGVSRVVACHKDPNPLVNGGGFQELLAAGLTVDHGALKEEAARLNEKFLVSITRGRPFGILKAAQTLDGRIGGRSGESKWITGETARSFARGLRSTVDAVGVGVETVLRDDPDLRAPRTADAEGDAPARTRLVFDSRLRTPPTCRLLGSAPRDPVLILTTPQASDEAEARLCAAGADVLRVPATQGGTVDLVAAAAALHSRGIQSCVYEGGGRLHDALLSAGLVDKVMLFIAGKLLGGRDGIPVVDRLTPEQLSEALAIPCRRIRRIGDDCLYESDLYGTLPI